MTRPLLEIEALAGIDPLSKPRARCIKIIVGLVGDGGMQEFLRQPQPALEGRTGGDLLQHSPELLLARLEQLHAQMDISGEGEG